MIIEEGHVVIALLQERIHHDVVQIFERLRLPILDVPWDKDRLVRSQLVIVGPVWLYEVWSDGGIRLVPVHSAVQVHQILSVEVSEAVHVNDEDEPRYVDQVDCS